MKAIFCTVLCAAIGIGARAQTPTLMVDDNEFKVDKKVVAKVKDVKLGGFQGREKRLLGPNDEVLLALPTKSLTIGNPPRYINYASISVPALNDSIQIYIDSLKADGVKIGLAAPDDDAWAAYLFRKQIVNSDGTLNIENVKALKARYPVGVAQDHEQRTRFAAECAKQIQTPNSRNAAVAAVITEVSRETNGNTAMITYSVTHDGMVLGKIMASGPAINLNNERAEVDFTTKMFYKKADMENQPMSFEILNNQGCKLASYSPMSKVLTTIRADKGGTHGIMKPILDGKAESVKTRLEVVGAIADYLIKLGYL